MDYYPNVHVYVSRWASVAPAMKQMGQPTMNLVSKNEMGRWCSGGSLPVWMMGG